MVVFIGSARIDENKLARGGVAGDQTGGEISEQEWYAHPLGWRVFRALSADAAQRIAKAMRAACDNPHIGYDQSERDSLWDVAAKLGFDPGRVAIDCETDCSALVRVCLAYAGIKTNSFRTATQAEVLLKTGRFAELTDPAYTESSEYLRAGDILVTRERGHTVVVLTNGARIKDDPFEPEDEPLCPEPAVSNGWVTVDFERGWEVYSEPDDQSDVAAVVRQGEKLRYYGQIHGWYAVKRDAVKGYISPNAFRKEEYAD